MENINDIEAFVKIADMESFSAAARALHMPKSTLSRRIARMEERLGVQLFVRSTRQISLTEMGEVYYQRCRQIVWDIKDAQETIKMAMRSPQGTLRLTCPSTNGSDFIPHLLSTFMREHPEISLEVETTNRFVHIVDEGYDLALRGGALHDSTMKARRLTPVSLVLAASPMYLKERGVPQRPDDLQAHDCLMFDHPPSDRRWTCADGSYVQIKGRLLVNDLEVLRRAALEHQGIIRVPRHLIEEDLERGALTLVLEEHMTLHQGLYAIYPPNRFMSAKVRAFIDFAVAYFQQTPLLADGPEVQNK